MRSNAVKTLKVRAPRDLHAYLANLDIGLMQIRRYWDLPEKLDVETVSLKRLVPDQWAAEIDEICKLTGASRTIVVTRALQHAAASKLLPRTAIPRDT